MRFLAARINSIESGRSGVIVSAHMTQQQLHDAFLAMCEEITDNTLLRWVAEVTTTSANQIPFG